MAAHCAGGADAGGIFARPAVDDGVDGYLEGVLVCEDVDLEEVLAQGSRAEGEEEGRRVRRKEVNFLSQTHGKLCALP